MPTASAQAELAALAAALLVLYAARRRHRPVGSAIALPQAPEAALVAAELEQAKTKVAELSARLRRLQQPAPALSIGRNEIRIWMDGAFDMFHYGHANAFRQGRSLGTYLVVGVNDDASITECKGPPVLNDDERIRMVSGCKFVDEVRLA